jgi:hypothetical protein
MSGTGIAPLPTSVTRYAATRGGGKARHLPTGRM